MQEQHGDAGGGKLTKGFECLIMIKQMAGVVARKLIPNVWYVKIRQTMLKPKLDRRFQKVKKTRNSMAQIVVIGDSHSRFFSGAPPKKEVLVHWDKNGFINYCVGSDKRFCAFKLGPALAFNLNGGGSTTRALEKYKWLSQNMLNNGDLLICAFGEIDIRAHVFKHVTGGKTYKNVVDEICAHYVEFLKIIEEDGFCPVVWGPIASQKDEWRESVEVPAIGGEQERNMATEYFYERMKRECDINGWGFISIYKSLVDDDYRTRSDYIYDKCHLGSTAKPLLEKELERLKFFS